MVRCAKAVFNLVLHIDTILIVLMTTAMKVILTIVIMKRKRT